MTRAEKERKDWEEICQAYCKQIGAELLFVNDDSFGYDHNGNLVHLYIDELQEILENRKVGK